jgi:hypothetical protein
MSLYWAFRDYAVCFLSEGRLKFKLFWGEAEITEIDFFNISGN